MGLVGMYLGGMEERCRNVFGHSKMTGEEKWVILTYGLSKENCLQKLFFNKFIEMSCRQETIVSVEANLKLEPSFLATAILHILYFNS